jgi:hypothetical protein
VSTCSDEALRLYLSFMLVKLRNHLLTYLLWFSSFCFFTLFCFLSIEKKSPVQKNLRWDCDTKTASNICNFNRHYAEHSGYLEGKSKFLAEAKASSKIEFFDSNTGKLLYTAPIGRTMDDFLIESKAHGKFYLLVTIN